jgi:hypothetical protein
MLIVDTLETVRRFPWKFSVVKIFMFTFSSKSYFELIISHRSLSSNTLLNTGLMVKYIEGIRFVIDLKFFIYF